MIRFLLLRIILPLIGFLILRALLVAIGRAFSSLGAPRPPQNPKAAPNFRSGGELRKDPVCGTYVSVEGSITKEINGEVIHFCSAGCRDKYRAT